MAEPKKAVVIDLMTAMKSHLNALPICPRCNRREPRLYYCAGWDREAGTVVLRVKGHEPIVLKLDEVK